MNPAGATDLNATIGDSTLIQARGIGVRQSGRWLVRDVDLNIERGQIVTLIGPNGSGKTTTAKVILGIHKPDTGTLTRADGVSIGYVPQKVTISRTLPMTVARLINMTRRYSKEQLVRALSAVGIGHLMNRQVHDLSGGEFQRALLARALVAEPDLLVLDEPVQGVDFTGEIELYDLIRKVRDESGCAVLLISHDLHVVMAHTDHVLCLNGHVCCQGSPKSIADDPEYIGLFGRHGAQALAIYRHEHDHTHGPDGSIEHGHNHEHHGHSH